MDKYTQYTVLVSNGNLLDSKNDNDWKKIAFKLRHSNKLFLSFAISVYASLALHMKSSYLDHDLTPLYITSLFCWAIAGHVLLCFSLKNVQYKDEKSDLASANYTSHISSFVEDDRIFATNKTQNYEIEREAKIVLSKIKELEIPFQEERESLGLQYLLDKHYLETYEAVKRICLAKYTGDDLVKCEKGFYVLEHSQRTGKKSIRTDIPPQENWEKGITKSVYKSICSGRYEAFNSRLRWLSK